MLYYKNSEGDNIQKRFKLRFPEEARKQTMEGYISLANGDLKIKFMPIKAPTKLLFIGLDVKVSSYDKSK